MKKFKFLLLTFLLIPITGHAAVFHCSAPGSVVSGQNITVNIYGNLNSPDSTWKGTVVAEGNVRYAGGDLNLWGDGASFSSSVNFTAGDPGTAKFYVADIDVSDENQEYSGSDVCTVSIVAATSSNSSSGGSGGGSSNYVERSSNNNLKSITIDGVTLSPEFNKDNLEYKGVVNGDKEKINIGAEAEDDKSSIDGLGEKDLAEGVNRFELKVTAETGDEKVYVIEITRKEKNPIEVIINKKKYTVFKKESNVEPPKGFIKTNVVIEKQNVVAYSNKYIDYILVLLVDEDGNSSWYIYNSKNSTYTKYNEIKSGKIRLVFIKAPKIPSNYKKTKIKINKEQVEAYYIKGISDYKLVYAINMNSGDEAFYQYDTEEKTFQRYNTKLLSSVEEFNKKLETIIVGAAALVLILTIIIISLITSKKRMKKAIKTKKENDAIERLTKKEENKIEEPKEEVKEEKKLSRKELRKLKKEEKKRLKKESEDFLK